MCYNTQGFTLKGELQLPSVYEINRNKTHCKHGHPFDSQNTYHDPSGRRACRTCQRLKMKRRRKNPRTKEHCLEISRRSYNKNKAKYYESARAARQAIRKNLSKLKAESGCRFCPEKDPDCLDFHHEDPAKKKFNLSNLCAWPSQSHILEEIKKCFIVCSNCHRKLEARKRRKESTNVAVS